MSKNRKGMHKEWHSKRVNLEIEIILSFISFLEQTYDFENAFGSEVAQTYHDFTKALYKLRGSLKIDEYCGQYLVEYGYNWVSDTDGTQDNKIPVSID